jgi:hypothetical protein
VTGKTARFACQVEGYCMRRIASTFLITFAMLLPTVSASRAAVERCRLPEAGLHYTIFNDRDDVGDLNLKVKHEPDITTIDVAMDIKISILAIPAYSFRHRSQEIWTGGQLVRSQARSVDNGRTKDVKMQNLGDRYLVESDDGPIRMTGARLSELIWCEALIKQGKVISTLTGSVDDYPFDFVGDENLDHRGQMIATRHYRFTRKKRTGDIWYDRDGVVLRVDYPTRYYTTASFVRKY